MYTKDNEWGCDICLEDKLEHDLETIYFPCKSTATPDNIANRIKEFATCIKTHAMPA